MNHSSGLVWVVSGASVEVAASAGCVSFEVPGCACDVDGCALSLSVSLIACCGLGLRCLIWGPGCWRIPSARGNRKNL